MTISPSRTNDAPLRNRKGDIIAHQRRLLARILRPQTVSEPGEFSTGTSGDYSAGTHRVYMAGGIRARSATFVGFEVAMPKPLFKRFRHRKRRIKEGLQDHRRFKLYRAACLLLAQRDYEQIPVAHFAKQAEISVGAFYERFPNKDAFMGSVVALRFDDIRERMEAQLDSSAGNTGPPPP
jgi:Bacterial regulatory proteins, tetR family